VMLLPDAQDQRDHLFQRRLNGELVQKKIFV
jgi:hypothetical protein